MRKIKYPLVISDFDGTLVKADGEISEENKKAIADYSAAGGAFAISTGRLPAGILPRARELGLKGLVCCCQGAIVIDIESGDVVFEDRLSLQSTIKACKKMEEFDLHIHLYDLWDYYSNKDDEALTFYEQAVRRKAIRITDEPLSAFAKRKEMRAYKLLAMVEEEKSKSIVKELEKADIDGCTLTQSGSFLVEIVNKAYSKATAVEFLANHYGVPVEKTLTIGDQLNDIPMIERAGFGVAVANADEALKNVADFVSDKTNEEGAVGRIIEEFVYTEE